LVTNGTVVGPVEVSSSLEMQPKARIVGDVGYMVIEMHQGAVIEGKLIHRGASSTELTVA
jgi:cytoskeletal protein CcmA (bactofilin family)